MHSHKNHAFPAVVGIATAILAGLLPGTAAASPTAPSAPTGLVAEAGDSTVSLSWDQAQANVAPVDHYKIYRARSSNAVLIAVTDTTRFDDSSVTNHFTYSYWVSAVNTLGEESGLSDPVYVAPFETPPPGLPASPIDIDAHTTKTGELGVWAETAISWKAPPTDGGSAIIRYRIYRDNGSEGSLKHLRTVPATTFSYVDGHNNGESKKDVCFRYQVRAENANGEGVGSPIVAGGPCMFDPNGS